MTETQRTPAYCSDYTPNYATIVAVKGSPEFARLQDLDSARQLQAGIGIDWVPVGASVGDRVRIGGGP